MMIGERIEARRKDLGLSQAAVARGSGTPQQTLNSIIKKNPRSSPHLVRLAAFLQTTPAYLTGETDDPLADAPDAPIMTVQELELIDCFRVMTPRDRAAFLQIGCTMAGRDLSPKTFHQSRQDFQHEGAKR